MTEHQPETKHVLPMAWTLHQTARLTHFLARCEVADCEACGRIKAEILRRETSATPTDPRGNVPPQYLGGGHQMHRVPLRTTSVESSAVRDA